MAVMADKVSLPTPDEEVVFSSRSSIRFDFTKSLYNSVCNGVNLHITTCSTLILIVWKISDQTNLN